MPVTPLKNPRRSRRPGRGGFRLSSDELLDDVFQYDHVLASDFLRDHISRKPKMNAAFGNNRGEFLSRGTGRLFVSFQFVGKIVCFEIHRIFPVPVPALSAMQFPLTFRPTAGLLSLALPGMGHKPPVANLARPLPRYSSFHRALFCMQFESTIVYRMANNFSGV
jgi:hypothetical protein